MRKIYFLAVAILVLMTLASCVNKEAKEAKAAEQAKKEALSSLDAALYTLDETKIAEAIKNVSPDDLMNVLDYTSIEAVAILLDILPLEIVKEYFSEYANPVSEFTYDLNSEGNGIIIQGYTGKGADLIIPMEIEGYPVVQIGKGADWELDRRRMLTSVIIPRGVKIIANGAFAAQKDILTVAFPSTLVRIGDYAFQHCYSLSFLDLSRTSLVYLGSNAFYNYPTNSPALHTVKLPDTLTEIGELAFQTNTSLRDVNIPANIKAIDGWAFRSCKELVNLSIPDSVTSIEWTRRTKEASRNAFEGCGKLPLATRQRLKDLGYEWNF